MHFRSLEVIRVSWESLKKQRSFIVTQESSSGPWAHMDTMLSLMICGHCLLIHSNLILELVLCEEGTIRQLSTHRSLEPQLPLGLTSCHLPTSLEWVPSHLLPQLDLTSLFLLLTSDLHDFFCTYVFVFCD